MQTKLCMCVCVCVCVSVCKRGAFVSMCGVYVCVVGV